MPIVTIMTRGPGPRDYNDYSQYSHYSQYNAYCDYSDYRARPQRL